MKSSIDVGAWLLAVGRRLPLLLLAAPLILLAAMPPSQYTAILAGYTSLYLIVCHVILIIYGIFALSLINAHESNSALDVVLVSLPNLAVAYASWNAGHSLPMNGAIILIALLLLFIFSGRTALKVVLARSAPFVWLLVYGAGSGPLLLMPSIFRGRLEGLFSLFAALDNLRSGCFSFNPSAPSAPS